MSGPLEGIRVVELTSTVSGPFAGMILADQGADVVKIEPPGIGDIARYMGGVRSGMGAMFSVINRNKRSVVLDLKEKKEFKVLQDLIRTADVLIENYRPGVVKKLGIDYENIKETNPSIIYVSISGYGQSGPYKNIRVYDPLIQATAGSASAQNSEQPEFFRSIVFDKVTGLIAAQAISTALLQKERTGDGQYLPISMLDSALYYLWPDVMWSRTLLGEGVVEAGELADYFPLFRAKDKSICIILVADPDFVKFCEQLNSKLYEDEKFSTMQQRVKNSKLFVTEVEKILKDKEASQLRKELDELGIPVAVINDLDEIHKDPQVIHQNSLVEVDHPIAGNMRMPKPPFNFLNQDIFPKSHAPILGQHNREILTELGVDEEEIKRMELRERGYSEAMKGMLLSQVANEMKKDDKT